MGADHFITGLRLRMADLEIPGEATCQTKTGTEEDSKCGAKLDPKGEHCLKCGKGRANIGPHKAIEVSLQACVKEYGLFADCERTIPELYKKEDGVIKEAILDVVIRAPSNPRTRLIDVTIRSPHRKGKDNSENPGAMARQGERDKNTRYGDQAMALAFESYGRMTQVSRKNLRQIAWDAAIMQTRSRDRPAAVIYSEWRLKLERTLVLELADVVLQCLGRWAPRLSG